MTTGLSEKAVRLLKSRAAKARDSGQEVRNDVQLRTKTDPNIKSQGREINEHIRQHLKMSGTPCRVDETHIEVGKVCKYLYRAVDREGNTIELMLGARRGVSAAKRFFKKMTRAERRRPPFSISADKNAAYPEAFSTSQEGRIMPKDCKPRRVKYLNGVICNATLDTTPPR